MLTYKNVFGGENQLLLPADVGIWNIATALPFTHHVSMALKVKTAETKVVLVNLLICVVVFYTVYYVVLSVCFAVFKIKMLDGLGPFDFKTSPSWINPYYLVLVISLEITFFICGLLFALVVEEWVWDYAVTVTIIHITITSVVMSEFPLMLHWWLALGSGVISMTCGGQILAYCLFKDNFIYPILDDF
ncbi:transmembrane protein 244 isoform X2 [Accipiter gentilis]|uniref:transmembrane protein 244 isoform X2 n=1 Tax=Astur gentilis TaxID=8957 RepID=UPI00210F7524|nr:transmembrane protein 244 isoform X2 [Accipiter gentilis]